MISPSVLAAASEISRSFQSAKPFKHICVDNFLLPEEAEQALKDFPAFERKNAINEFGEVGRKAVNTKLGEISPFYANFYKWLFSSEFLAEMSDLTGIPGLIGDPSLYGGGTHENLDGQELDPHVDFNYVSGGDAHRRVNLLIYLNKNWDPAWGGGLEIHSNPRDPESDQISTYDLAFNRAIMFETNEYSWHGFPKIHLPETQRDKNSRKCLSIYLYTRTRPVDEIAGMHGTFYVQRPIGATIKPGHVLTSGEVDELRKGFRNRDRSIEAYQKLHRYLNEIVGNVRLPILGYALQLRLVSGKIWHDGWSSSSFEFEMRAVRDLSRIEMRGIIPYAAERAEISVSLATSEGDSSAVKLEGKNFVVTCPVNLSSGTVFRLSAVCSASINLKKEGKGDDDRDLSFLVTSIELS
jgi:hypothetical protein